MDFEDFQDWLTLGLHGAVVCLHATEISHATVINVGVFIAISYMAMSSLEAYHLRKKLRTHHHQEKK